MVTGLGNARIEPYLQTYNAARARNWEGVREGQRRINELFGIIRLCGDAVAAPKAASELAGRGSRWIRQRSQSLADEQVEKVATILRDFDRKQDHHDG
jgi:dihydrodipicolinate synthase/N-acetylneuraminate lyase